MNIYLQMISVSSRGFDRHEDDARMLANMEYRRRRVHEWGKRNRVEFDPLKEDIVWIHPIWHSDRTFIFLDITFDCNLSMASDIAELVHRCRPKIRSIIRARRYYSTQQSLNLFKTQIWGLIEYHTACIYHACDTHLSKLDHMQSSFLDTFDMSAATAFLQHNFAPLCARRDIAMLAVLHKRVLGLGHAGFAQLFPFEDIIPHGRHNKQLIFPHDHVVYVQQSL